ncbi:hypothetical protein PGT21_033350 [Puccinia graminis f. sp. tritici]|uniref:BED-type domain-containing protein n=1 Tax=Puccinia graminis f. sp. tritici TaxID=56615 RepID=A0A5B0QCK3_PUCGR|nr:hypothetical protein PGT21_033350 [Puccinia graminis f. sp. tritici]
MPRGKQSRSSQITSSSTKGINTTGPPNDQPTMSLSGDSDSDSDSEANIETRKGLSQDPPPTAPTPTPSNKSTKNTRNLASNQDSEASTEPASKKRKTTSDVWAHFKEQGSGENLKAICCSCKTPLSGRSKSGTNHLWRHLS